MAAIQKDERTEIGTSHQGRMNPGNDANEAISALIVPLF
jgi:hypothetical protein